MTVIDLLAEGLGINFCCLEVLKEIGVKHLGALPETDESRRKEQSNFIVVMKQSAMHLMAIFILVYVGVEVTIGGGLLLSTTFIRLSVSYRLDRDVYDQRTERGSKLRIRQFWILCW